MQFAAAILRWVLGFIYFFMKLFPTDNNKIVFLSRQSNRPTEDFLCLQKRLKEVKPDIKIVMITKRADKSFSDMLSFGIMTLKSMYELATSRVCILDAYWPAVSILKHKKQLCVIQLWHAMAKIKRSGYQTLDYGLGRSEKLARAMRMHRGYDVIIAGGRAFNPFYCASFGVSEDILYNVGLPRMDSLRENIKENQKLFYEQYPELIGKKLILYAPTFRRGRPLCADAIIDAFNDKPDCVLIIKRHPNQTLKITGDRKAYTCEELKSSQILPVCDCVISDYSAISIEAALLKKPLYFYLFDLEDYIRENGLNVVLSDEFSDCVFSKAEDLACYIESGEYNYPEYERFCKKYLPDQSGRATDKIVGLIIDCIERDKHEAISERICRQNRIDRNMGR